MTVTQRRSPTPVPATTPFAVQVPGSPPACAPETGLETAEDTPDAAAPEAMRTEVMDPADATVEDAAAPGPAAVEAAGSDTRANAEITWPRPARYGIQMPRRRPALVWLAQTVTLGVGHLRWLRRASRELADLDARAAVDLRRTTLAIVPGALLLIPACLAWHRLGRRIAGAQYAAGLVPTCRPGRGVLLAFALGAVAPYYQAELNKIIDWYGYPPDAPVPLYD